MRKYIKGFELIYFNLSYRRKFIRTLWTTSFVILILVFNWFLDIPSFLKVPVIAICIVVDLIQLSWNYYKMKKEQEEKTE